MRNAPAYEVRNLTKTYRTPVVQANDSITFTADVGLSELVDTTVTTFGRLDVMVANAGIALWENSWETDPDEWWHVFEVNH